MFHPLSSVFSVCAVLLQRCTGLAICILHNRSIALFKMVRTQRAEALSSRAAINAALFDDCNATGGPPTIVLDSLLVRWSVHDAVWWSILMSFCCDQRCNMILSYSWQTAQHLCAACNGVCSPDAKNTSPSPRMCHHADFSRSTSRAVGIGKEPRNCHTLMCT